MREDIEGAEGDEVQPCRRCAEDPCVCEAALAALGFGFDREQVADALDGAGLLEEESGPFEESQPELDSAAVDDAGRLYVPQETAENGSEAADRTVIDAVAEAVPVEVVGAAGLPVDEPMAGPPQPSTALATTSPGALLRADAAILKELRENASAPGTATTYGSHWKTYLQWCASRGIALPMPADPNAVALFLSWYGREAPNQSAKGGKGHSASTVQGALAAVAWHHKQAGHILQVDSPLIRAAVDGHRRTVGVRPVRRLPLRVRDLVRLLPFCYEGKRAGHGDMLETLLKTFWWTALREGSGVKLRVNDIRFHVHREETSKDVVRDGILVKDVHVVEREYLEICERDSKTDQVGVGRWFVVWAAGAPKSTKEYDKRDLCLVKALRGYIERAKLSGEDFLFPAHGKSTTEHIHEKSVPKILKSLAEQAGYSKEEVALIAGHSLRRGWATTALEEGENVALIRRHLNHKDESTTLIYLDMADSKELNATRNM